MKISRNDAPAQRIDSSLQILQLFDGTDFKFNVVLSVLHGDHGRHVNHVSDRAYFILSGEFRVQVGSDTYNAGVHDMIVIPADVPHGIAGDGEFLVITAPPFAPENEEDL